MFAFNLGFAGVGGATEYPQGDAPSQFRPAIEATPELADAGVETIRNQGTLIARKPGIADVSGDELAYGPSNRALTAQQTADDMRISYAVSNAYKRRGEARARAQNRQAERVLKNSDSAGRINRRKLQGQTKRMEKSSVLRFAREGLGMGTDLYR